MAARRGDARHARRDRGERRHRRLARPQARRRRAPDGVRPSRVSRARSARRPAAGGAAATRPDAGRIAFATDVERRALAALARFKPGRALQSNVELNAALLLEAVGVPRDAFTPVFALARIAGWLAHALEQQRTGRMIRPTSRYVGPMAGAPDSPA